MTNEDVLNDMLRKTFPNVIFCRSINEGNKTRAIHFSEQWLEEEYTEPKTGHWIKTISENGITSAVRCSECGFEDNRYMLFRYCPNCGAKMVDPQESEE